MTENNRIIELLEEILLWTKYDFEEIKQKMIEALDTDEKKIAYQLTDGENSTTQIASVIPVSQVTVSNWWRNWLELGIVKQTEKFGGKRRIRLISLAEMGIPFPDIPVIGEEDEQRAS